MEFIMFTNVFGSFKKISKKLNLIHFRFLEENDVSLFLRNSKMYLSEYSYGIKHEIILLIFPLENFGLMF